MRNDISSEAIFREPIRREYYAANVFHVVLVLVLSYGTRLFLDIKLVCHFAFTQKKSQSN